MEQGIAFLERALTITMAVMQWLNQAFWETLGHILSGNFNDATIGAILVFIGSILFLFLLVMMTLPPKKSIVAPEQDILAGLTLYQRAEPQKQEDDTDQAGQEQSDPSMRELRRIEQDMMALKELFDAGLIKARIYINESKSLYLAAKAIYPD